MDRATEHQDLPDGAVAVQHVIPSVASLANLVSAVMGYKRAVENVEAPAAAAYSTQVGR